MRLRGKPRGMVITVAFLETNARSSENLMLKTMFKVMLKAMLALVLALAANVKSLERRIPKLKATPLALASALRDRCKLRLAMALVDKVDRVRPTPALADKPVSTQVSTETQASIEFKLSRLAAAMP